MTVAQLINRIVGLSHNENAPDTKLQEKALGWLNSAYFELLTELQPFQLDARVNTLTLTTSTIGFGEILPRPQRILNVVDKTNNSVLTYLRTHEFLEQFPIPVDHGQPQYFRLNTHFIEVYPMDAIEVQVTYIPEPKTLHIDDIDTAIQLPSVYHQALIWGALTWGSIYERDFSAAADISLFQTKWEDAKRAAKLALIAKGGRAIRTAPANI